MLDLYVCLRPVQYFTGVPSPVKHPEKVDMVIFRENTEDIYAGIEYAAGTPEAQRLLDFLAENSPKDFKKIRFGTKAAAEEFWKAVGAADFPSDVQVGIGIKPVSYSGTVRLIHSAISYAIASEIGHARSQGQHHEVHRGRLPRRKPRREYFGAGNRRRPVVQDPEGNPARAHHQGRHRRYHAPATTRPTDFDVIATLNLNGDYLSDALAAQVGGIIAPGQYQLHHRPRYLRSHHGTAPKCRQGSSIPAVVLAAR